MHCLRMHVSHMKCALLWLCQQIIELFRFETYEISYRWWLLGKNNEFPVQFLPILVKFVSQMNEWMKKVILSYSNTKFKVFSTMERLNINLDDLTLNSDSIILTWYNRFEFQFFSPAKWGSNLTYLLVGEVDHGVRVWLIPFPLRGVGFDWCKPKCRILFPSPGNWFRDEQPDQHIAFAVDFIIFKIYQLSSFGLSFRRILLPILLTTGLDNDFLCSIQCGWKLHMPFPSGSFKGQHVVLPLLFSSATRLICPRSWLLFLSFSQNEKNIDEDLAAL